LALGRRRCALAARRRRLAGRRRSLGYSQEHLAGQLGVDRTTVGRWERGETDPYPYIRRRLCQVLQVPAGELDTLLAVEPDNEPSLQTPHTAPVISGHVVAGPDPMGALDDMYRRELLRLLSIAAVTVAMPEDAVATGNRGLAAARGPADIEDIEQYAALNAHLWQVFALSRAKRQVYPLVHEHLGVLIGQMNRGQPAAVHRQLCVLACDLFQLAGEIFFDSNRYAEAAHCYVLAASAGREARCYDRWACALTRQAFISMYDRQYPQAAAILTAAARVAHNGDSQLSTRQWVAAVQAQAYAGLGDQQACNRALDTANRVLDLADTASPGGWLRFDGSRLAEERGTCYLTTGQHTQAEAALTEALSRTVSLRRRGSLLTDLAVLGAQRRDIDQVLHYAADAVDLAEQTGSTGYVGRKLCHLQAEVRPLLADARVAELNERITRLPVTS
jgi:transcriptional regulator with XRE-family HTH domain